MATRPVTFYRHVQESAAATWTIPHGLLSYPIVDVYVDYEGQVQKILPSAVTYTDANTVTVTFSEPKAGFATVTA